MDISRISRRIIVAIFTLVIFSLCIMDCMLVFNAKTSTPFILKILKSTFFIILIAFTLVFAYIKEKMNKLNVERKISLLYRYIYLIIVIVTYNIYMLHIANVKIYSVFSIFVLVGIIAISINIKKIIFNVSKSDVLSVFGMGFYVFLPKVINDKTIYIVSIIITFLVTLSIYFIQKIIDELKQQGIKNKKYIIYSIYTGVSIAISIILGFNPYIYFASILLLFLITVNLDSTHINFPKKVYEDISPYKRELLYKIERININKLIISIINITFLAVVLVTISNYAFNYIGFSKSSNQAVQVLDYVDNVQNYNQRFLDFNSNIDNIKENTEYILNSSTLFYIFMFTYIFILELLTYILRRRYDTKTTFLKIIYLLTIIMVVFTNSKSQMIDIYHNIFTVITIIIAILNTSNIYLNREERIKLLNP